MQPRQVPSSASLLTLRHQLLPQRHRARASPPKGLFGNDRKELVGAGASRPAFAMPAYKCLLLTCPALLSSTVPAYFASILDWQQGHGAMLQVLLPDVQEDEIFRLQNMQKESQEQEEPRQEKPQQVCLRLFSCC